MNQLWHAVKDTSRRLRAFAYDARMPDVAAVMRYAWAAPNTVLGLLVVAVGSWRARVRIVDGVVEAHGPVLAWMLTHLTPLAGGVSALTLGHVVIARDARTLDATRAHERVHVRQYETWGPLFVPAYLAASLMAVGCGRHFYFGNRFELEAFAPPGVPSRRGRGGHEGPRLLAQPGRSVDGGVP